MRSNVFANRTLTKFSNTDRYELIHIKPPQQSVLMQIRQSKLPEQHLGQPSSCHISKYTHVFLYIYVYICNSFVFVVVVIAAMPASWLLLLPNTYIHICIYTYVCIYIYLYTFSMNIKCEHTLKIICVDFVSLSLSFSLIFFFMFGFLLFSCNLFLSAYGCKQITINIVFEGRSVPRLYLIGDIGICVFKLRFHFRINPN